MTENERFDWDLKGIWDYQSDSDEYIESSEEICVLLNKLNEENKRLKYEIEKVCEFNEDLLEEKRIWKKLSDNYAKLYEENENLKAQLCYDESVCNICQYQYLVERDKYYVAKCEKRHEKCSKEDIKYCEDFKCKELEE